MPSEDFRRLFEFTRGETIESVHFGAIAVVDIHGKVLAHWGNQDAVTFLRSTAKPIQVMPFVEAGGVAAYNLSQEELSVMCASHSGTDAHVEVISNIQRKAGLSESHLMCGVHPPIHRPTAQALSDAGIPLTSNRHNCSGKHTGMLAFAQMNSWPLDGYLNTNHPVQKAILKTFSEMTNIPQEAVHLGVNGCSAPNFAIPMTGTALAFARLADPSLLTTQRAAACTQITNAMRAYPMMVGGPDRFDTVLLSIAGDKIVCKGGAEGYQGIGLFPGTLTPDSPGIGIAIKISDGDRRGTVGNAVAVEVLRQLGVLSAAELDALSSFAPQQDVYNWRKIKVGEAHPCFKLQ